MSSKASSVFTPARSRALKRIGLGIVVPTVPMLMWWNWSIQKRKEILEQNRTKVRVPNVQTIDDIMVERCRPGDVVLFDRRWEHCASGPLAAFLCVLGRAVLCSDDPSRSVQSGYFDHCGIVVPGYAKSKAEELDPSNLLLLEATPGEGIVARPLLERIEVSQSRSVLLLPLSYPNERRNDPLFEHSDSTKATEALFQKRLKEFRDTWTEVSKTKNYKWEHSTLGIFGAVAYAIGLHTKIPAPTSPSAWVVTQALQAAKAAQNLSDRTILETKVEDFLRDYRFQDTDTVRLRPGWRFLHPVSMREQ